MAPTANGELRRRANTNAITAARVSAAPDHLSWLPKMAERDDILPERAIYDLLRGMSPDYSGGGGEYVQLSNGGF